MCESVENRGKANELNLEVKKSIYATWNNNSIVTVDRRDGRDVVSMREDDFNLKFSNLDSPSRIVIENFVSNRNKKMVRTTKRIVTKTVIQIQNEVEIKCGYKVSIGSVVNYKPFYVNVASEREKESCLCKFCLNIRLRLDQYQRLLIDKSKIFMSISEFFANADNRNCELDANGFWQLRCINGTCTDCELIKPFKREVKNGARTIRKTFIESFEEFESNLYTKQNVYLLHRYECRNDQYHWPIIRGNCLGYTYHMDYSENISNSPKYEPQDAHFSSKQISLHCTVVHPVDADVSYAYHLSDDKCHDSAFTSNAIDDLLETYHEYKNYPVLHFKSDNCSSQYCCRYSFPYYSELYKAE